MILLVVSTSALAGWGMNWLEERASGGESAILARGTEQVNRTRHLFNRFLRRSRQLSGKACRSVGIAGTGVGRKKNLRPRGRRICFREQRLLLAEQTSRWPNNGEIDLPLLVIVASAFLV